MIKLLLASSLALLITGCVPKPVIIYKPQLVEVPVPYVPPLPYVLQPMFVTNLLTDADAADPGKVAQAYRADNLLCKDTLKIYRDRDAELNMIRTMIEEQSAPIRNMIKGTP